MPWSQRQRIAVFFHRVADRNREKDVYIKMSEDGIERWYSDRYGEELDFRIEFADILRLVAFKRDCFVYDMICLRLEAAWHGPDYWLDITERDTGWNDALRFFDEYTGKNVQKATYAVTYPPFATNETVVWKRPCESDS